MKNFEYHAENIFKLLALIIISVELGILRALVFPSTLLEKTAVLLDADLICEYIFVSLAIYIIGYVFWCVLKSKGKSKKNRP